MDLEELKKSLLKKFQEESADRLQKIQLAVLDLEKPDSAHAADAVARELHTMKGEARILDLAGVGQVAHAAEDVLRSAREGKTAVRVATDLLLRACDAVSDLLEEAEAAREGTEASKEICRRLAEASSGVIATRAKEAESEPDDLVIEGVAPDSSAAAGGQGWVATSPQPSDQSLVEVISEPAPEATAQAARPAADRSIRVNVEILDQMGAVTGDLLVESSRARLRFSALNEILERFSRMGDRFLQIGETAASGNGTRQHAEILERDLHLLRDDAFRFVRQHADGLDTLHGSLAQLADDVAMARLVPLATIFDALPRAVRDMAHEQGKEVDLQIDNPNVGVDRSMVADVRDALVHLIRNAVDHGLEGPDTRQSLGKPRAGRIEIKVRVDGDMLHLDVSDDGQGIDPDRVKSAALSRKLINTHQALMMGEREALDLVFVPGFSTREDVNDLSGRGVGMDVVKRKVESLGGSVSLQSRMGRGTTVALRLPQSLSLMRVLLVRLGDDVYGVPAAEVEAVTRVLPKDRVELVGSVALQYRGQPTALVALGPLLGIHPGSTHERPPAVVVRHGQDRAALVVDGFVDEREVAVKPCAGELLKGARMVAGTAALEDGRIAVLLHVPDLMAEVRRVAKPVPRASSPRRLKVLLIDDSPIARATESALVKALGHLVDEAQDGEEGLSRIEAGTYDLILTDVQMPKMDGFALTRRIKSAPELAKLPVIILSSLASPEDKRRGLDAGADAYLVKGELGVETLAQTIERLI